MRLIFMFLVDFEENWVINDVDEMISWINGLIVFGGDDCFEYSFFGLIMGNIN